MVLCATSDAARFLQMALESIHPRIRPAAASVKRVVVVPMRAVPRAQAGDRRVSGGHAAADDSGQMFRLVLLEMAPEVPHALRHLEIPALLTFDRGLDLGIAGGGRGGSGGCVRGTRLVVLGALGT
jgi:hypothetical protein